MVKPVSFGQLAAVGSILTMLGVHAFLFFFARLKGKLYLKQQTTPRDIVLFIFIHLQCHYSDSYNFFTFWQVLQVKKLLRNISLANLTYCFQPEREKCIQFHGSFWCDVFRVVGSLCSYGIWKEAPLAHYFLLSFLLAHFKMHTSIIISFMSFHF